MDRGHHGYCAATTDHERGCRPGSRRGTWVLNAREAASWPQARAACARHCSSCAQCAFVSISLLHSDCSWYAADQCKLDRLQGDVHGFQTYEASSPLLKAALEAAAQDHSAARGLRGRWEAGAARADCDRPCVPSAACAAEVRAWAFDKETDNGVFFWVQNNLGLKALTKHLTALLTCPARALGPSPTLTFVDVGAGTYSGARGQVGFEQLDAPSDPHDSDALLLLARFGNRSDVHVHAFEMNPAKAAELEAAVRLRPATRRAADRFHVHQMGVGNATTRGRVVKCGGGRSYANTWRAMDAAEAPPSEDCDVGETFRLTRLDDFASERQIGGILYAKVDVEGGEFDVLRGMEGLLRQQRVEAISFEYALGWHPAYEVAGGPVPLAQRAAIQQTLHNFQRRLSQLGYDTYLIHARPSREAGASRGIHARDVTLVPVHGGFWHDDFEICFDRKKAYGTRAMWCWNDLFVVRRCNACVKHTLLKAVQGGRQLFPSCACI